MSTPGQPAQQNGDIFFEDSTSDAQSNGGAVQPSNGDNLGGFSASSTASSSTVREGKQKAKDVMSATTGTPGTPGSQGTAGANAPNGAGTQNGGPRLSRKRSRDGTLLPANKGNQNNDHSGPAEDYPPHDEILIDRYMQRDMLYAATMNDQAHAARNLVWNKVSERDFYTTEVRAARAQHPGSVFGYGFMGYGNRFTDGKSQIVFSDHRGAPKSRRNRQLHIPRKENAQQAEQHEELVPVRLDIELDKLRLRDTFTWNLHEKLISPDRFADYLLEDLKIPLESAPEILRQARQEMREQIDNFYPHIIVEDGPLEPNRPYNEHKDDEMRIMIKLNITIGRISLIDQFEWDINNPLNSPEEFAKQMASENALSGEFTTAIAHSIREQSQLYTKSLYLTNHAFDGRPVEDPELRDSFMAAPLHSAFRPLQAQKDWMPYLYEMSEAEFERTETSMMREHRAQKRQLNRRGGPALPDLKDRQRTVRSLVVHSVIPGAVEGFETTGIIKTRLRNTRTGRRAAAGGAGGARADGDGDSDELDSDDESGVDSPAPSMLNASTSGGTARTRGMRGAASAAQAAMRANYGRSQTPDSSGLATPHNDVRGASRRSMLREGSAAAGPGGPGGGEEDSLVVKLRLNKARFRAWVESTEKRKRAAQLPLSGYATLPVVAAPAAAAASSTPARSSAVVDAAGSAPSLGGAAGAGGQRTPSITPRALPVSRNTPQPNGTTGNARAASRQRERDEKERQARTTYDEQGRVETDHWPTADETPPPPPPWLSTAISTLRSTHPDDNFEPLMRPYVVNSAPPHEIIKPTITLPPGSAPTDAVTQKILFVPRIRCNDCPTKVYTAQVGSVVEDFEVHLRNRAHRERVGSRRSQSVR